MNKDDEKKGEPPVIPDLLKELQSEIERVGKNRLTDLVMTDRQLMEADFPPINWLVPNTIPNPGLVAISGRPGHYKTWLAIWLARRLSAGLPLFSFFEEAMPEQMDLSKPPPMKTRCLFIEQEMGRHQMKTRSLAMQYFEGSIVHWVIGGGVNIREKKWREWIEDYVLIHEIKLIILDPFTSVTKMKDENNNSEACEVMDIIRRSFVDGVRGCTVIFLHHPSKGDDSGLNLRGAGDILGKCDVHIALEKTNPKERIVQVRYEKNRDVDDAIISNFEMQLRNNIDDGRLEWVYLRQVRNDQKDRTEQIKQKILDLMATKESWNRSKVADQLGFQSNNNLFSKVWRDLQTSNLIIKTGGVFSINKTTK